MLPERQERHRFVAARLVVWYVQSGEPPQAAQRAVELPAAARCFVRWRLDRRRHAAQARLLPPATNTAQK